MKKFFHQCEDVLIGLLLVSTTLLVFGEVVARFVFNAGIHWAQEATLLMSGWMILLGASWAVRERAHIGVDILVDALSPNVRRWVLLVGVVACLFYCGLFLYGGWVYLSKLHMIGIELEDIAIPKWVATSVLIIGFGLLALRILELGINLLRGKDDAFHVHKENHVSKAFLEADQEEKSS